MRMASGAEGTFRSPKSVEFTSEVGGKHFTSARAVEIPDPSGKGGTALQVIHVPDATKALRGKGYGRELYEYMAGYAKSTGRTGLYGDMGTSVSAMRVVDSIAKRGKFKVEKNKDLQFVDEMNQWGSDSWTYKLSNKGLIPNYALFKHSCWIRLSTWIK